MPDLKVRYQSIENKLDQKADKADVQRLEIEVRELKDKVNTIIELLEKQSQTLEIIRIEQKAISATLSFHEERIGRLEDKVFGHRIRDDDAKYGKKH